MLDTIDLGVYVFMEYLGELLGLKINGIEESSKRGLIGNIVKNISRDTIPFLIKGIKHVDSIIVTNPFKTYSWILALSLTTVRNWGKNIIVYYNRNEPRWTEANILKGLILNANTPSGLLSENILSYLAVFKNNYLDLYLNGINESIEQLSSNAVTIDPLVLLIDIVPKIIAKGLVDYSYHKVVYAASSSDYEVIRLWLDSKPNSREKKAVAISFQVNGIDPENYGLRRVETAPTIIQKNSYELDLIGLCRSIEGADDEYCRMLRVLARVAEEPAKAWEILGPWRDEIAPIKDYVNEFIYDLLYRDYAR